jgi:hypothetical protein
MFNYMFLFSKRKVPRSYSDAEEGASSLTETRDDAVEVRQFF